MTNVRLCCPLCGHPSKVERYGVPLPPLKLRIFDLIEARPGISNAELASLLYEQVTPANLITTRMHIGQLRRDYFLDHPTIRIVGRPN